jgi:hypothetical protein
VPRADDEDALPFLRYPILNGVRADDSRSVAVATGPVQQSLEHGAVAWSYETQDVLEDKRVCVRLDHESQEVVDKKSPFVGTMAVFGRLLGCLPLGPRLSVRGVVAVLSPKGCFRKRLAWWAADDKQRFTVVQPGSGAKIDACQILYVGFGYVAPMVTRV